MKHPIIQVGNNRFVLDCAPTLDKEKAFGRLEGILRGLSNRLYSQRDDFSGHDGTYYNGTLYASIRPKYPLSPDTHYENPMLPWNVEIVPTTKYDLIVDTERTRLDEKMTSSKAGVMIEFRGHTINIFYDRPNLDKPFWDIDPKQNWVEIERLFS